MLHLAPAALIDHYIGISRLLAGQLDFRSAICSVAAEVAHIVPHDHLDVCVLLEDGNYHTAYETGIDTAWGDFAGAPVVNSPIRSLLWGEVDYLLADDAMTDPRFHFEGAFKRPIFEQSLRSRLHVPMKVQGTIIAALSCSSQKAGIYTMVDVERARIIADLLTPYFFALRAAEQAQRSAIVEVEARGSRRGPEARCAEAHRGARTGATAHRHGLARSDACRPHTACPARRPPVARGRSGAGSAGIRLPLASALHAGPASDHRAGKALGLAALRPRPGDRTPSGTFDAGYRFRHRVGDHG